MVVIPRLAGPAANFDPVSTIRIHRGTVAFAGEPKPKTTIDVLAAEGRIDTALSMDEVLAIIGTTPPLIRLSDADGFPVWANAAMITELRATDAWDRGGVGTTPGVNLYSKFFFNHNARMPQQVAETPDVVRQLAQAKNIVIP